jgi:hypothetical protein
MRQAFNGKRWLPVEITVHWAAQMKLVRNDFAQELEIVRLAVQQQANFFLVRQSFDRSRFGLGLGGKHGKHGVFCLNEEIL